MWFLETPPVFHWFFANVNACSPLTGIIRVFGHVGRGPSADHPQPATYCALCTVKGTEKSRMRTTYQKNSMRFGVFRILVFANVNGPIKIAFISAVYTGIKKPESFSHSGFSLKVARQLPLNTKKKTNRKTHLRSVIFFNSAEISLFFCQCKRSLQSRRYYSGFESPDRSPRRNAHYTCTVKGTQRSRSCAPLTKTQVWDSGFFRACAFLAKNPKCYGITFSGIYVNGTTKNPGFLDFGWLPM